MDEGDAACGMIADKFLPAADQRRFVSTWAIKEGEAKDVPGFRAERDLSQRQPFGHGSTRALSGWEQAKVPIPGSPGTMPHVISHNGCKMVELIHDRESVELKDKWTGQVSLAAIDAEAEKELKKLDRMGIKREEDNMKPRLVADEEEILSKP